MDNKRFQITSPGKLIKVGPSEVQYWAFVPNPLPPDIDWSQRLLMALSGADRAVGELAGLGRTLPNPHLLVRPFIQREAVLSSRIEGTRADLSDIFIFQVNQLHLPGFGSGASEHDIQEVMNYVVALEYGLDKLSSLPLSLRLIRKIHRRLMQGVRGEQSQPGHFRDRQNWIGGTDDRLESATFIPPPPDQMMLALQQFENYLHADSQLPPLARLALIHYQFEAIHPFIDGNGRIGRLLISLLTVHWNLLPLPLLYLSAYLEKQRDRYYDLLLAISQRGAWEEWLEFFLLGVGEQAHDAVRRARALTDLQQEWRDRLSGERSANPMRLANMLMTQPVLTIPDAQRTLEVAYNTARVNVNKLVAAGALQQIGETTYDKLYAATEVLEILS